MLQNILFDMQRAPLNTAQKDCSIREPSRNSRNEKEDMQKAIEYLYDFKRKLDELHPNCIVLIENLLQKSRYY